MRVRQGERLPHAAFMPLQHAVHALYRSLWRHPFRSMRMSSMAAILAALAAASALAVAGWLLSLLKRDVSLVDSLWSLFFLACGAVYALGAPPDAARTAVVLALLAAWSVRLSAYLTWRNWGEGEDRRYQALRRRHEPGFAWKSLGIVFLLQALLAVFVSLPLLPALRAAEPLGLLDAAGIALWCAGMVFEVAGDVQLARFKADPANTGAVLRSGLWRYTRHPNYFGEFCVWWGFYLIACAAGGWWTLASPLVMTLLLLKVSGVSLLEQDIGERRPAYADYARRTNAFFPGPPRSP